ncbi:daptide biosynthesis intramembrane metalloprotease [Microbacterium sp. PMB16]|uniref:daptide biosynthesis intramembrane metalloprotease n=1 Tax=Microbacterium sp. PMB16 TaxID=3120157 RepID=UPI003F4B62D7
MTDNRSPRATSPAPDPARPALAPLVTVDAPLDDDGAWIIAHDGVPKARVSAPVATVAQRFTGAATVDEIAADLGQPWTSADIDRVARHLADAGMLARVGAVHERTARARRRSPLRFRPPLTVQLSFGDPRALFAALRPLSRLALGAPGLLVALAVVLGGVIAAVLGWGDLIGVLQRPLPLPVLIWLVAAIVLTTLVHECGHGAALSRFGGSPRRIGAMLFYLAPAFFCDVTDGWRLSRRRERVIVALAGPAVHLLLAAAGVIAARFVSDAQLHAGLVLYSLSCLVIGVLNLLPFVQLDGYLALMSALDHPHLRRDAMDAAARATGAALLGIRAEGPPETERGSRWGWFVAYGLVCRLFPVGLVAFILYRYSISMAGLGIAPALAYLATLTLVAGVAVVGAFRLLRKLRSARPDWRQASVTVVVGAAVAGAVLFLIPLHPTQHIGFAVDDDGVRLVAGSGAQLPSAGTVVELETGGMLLPQSLGSAVVGDSGAQRDVVDLAALVPLSESALTATAWSTAAVDVENLSTLPAFGRARYAQSESIGVGAWLWQTFLARPIGALGSEAAR